MPSADQSSPGHPGGLGMLGRHAFASGRFVAPPPWLHLVCRSARGRPASVASQSIALWGAAQKGDISDVFFAAIFVIVSLLFPGGKRSVRNERSRDRYEQQIRDAGAQQERNRLARDLHDSIKQQIFVIQTAAATAQTRFDNDRDGAASAIDQIRSSARDAMTEMEAMMDQLRSIPLENASLIEALKKQCDALGHRTGAKVEFKLDDLPPSQTFAPGAHQAIFRVAQEALRQHRETRTGQ